ncbi:disease resistance protein RUN1-like isoform X2 [Rosa rugosa]|uniref:disease resistance protein RUN1-like isoform X2 n=1 Tax=Rosa rugosa TaxID=74645 RepID=UPI002B415396|nr:disease resistance protein RUN1-like isoform X2 [Rosa rugosa]
MKPSPPLPSPSEPPFPWKFLQYRPSYDVFLSFRGEDTRRTFTDHLYAALVRAGVVTFRDAEGLRWGENIAEKLVQIIQECRISLIVFSDKYADSRWCLQELVQIMECRRTRRQLVFPIFYHVDPSHVRNQTGSFAHSFQKYEEKMLSEKQKEGTDKIARWRVALREAANLVGFDIADRHEAEFVNSIVDEICRQLTNTHLNLAVYPVAIDSRVDDICNCLGVGLDDDVRMVGIWGMGGIGKTTVAKAIYNKFYHNFDSRSFLADVRETAKDSSGKIALQERLLSDVLKPAEIVVGDVSRGINVIRERLGSKKVLVIVDNVDHEDQLHALAIRHDSFGPGSRLIITTRDRHLLELLKVDTIHLTREMNEEEALELFSWHAFQNHSPDEDYIELSRKVVTYCGGLPLALEVLGSFLFGRSIGDWNSTLKKLKKIPHVKIQSKLRISFDAIDESERNIFLHICCFFIGMDKNYVIQILNSYGFSAEIEISVLLQHCLVTVNEKNKLMMHDLLRDMGREVVSEESPNRPERRSRLWREEDVIDVLTDESGTEETEGLALNLQRSDNMSFSTKAFRNMKRLKLLQLKYVHLTGDCDNFPKKLSWLCLRGFSPQVIRNEFLNETYLVSVDLRYSNLLRVLEDSRRLWRLAILNLSHSHYLRKSPDFSQLPNLQYLILKDCVSLPKIDKSIGHLHQLALLNLKGCTKLKDLPEDFYKLPSVRTLVLSGCSRFEKLSKDIAYMKLRTLLISGTAISEVPSSIDYLRDLDFSSRQGLSGLKRFSQDETSGPSRLRLRELVSLWELLSFLNYKEWTSWCLVKLKTLAVGINAFLVQLGNCISEFTVEYLAAVKDIFLPLALEYLAAVNDIFLPLALSCSEGYFPATVYSAQISFFFFFFSFFLKDDQRISLLPPVYSAQISFFC